MRIYLGIKKELVCFKFKSLLGANCHLKLQIF